MEVPRYGTPIYSEIDDPIKNPPLVELIVASVVNNNQPNKISARWRLADSTLPKRAVGHSFFC